MGMWKKSEAKKQAYFLAGRAIYDSLIHTREKLEGEYSVSEEDADVILEYMQEMARKLQREGVNYLVHV